MLKYKSITVFFVLLLSAFISGFGCSAERPSVEPLGADTWVSDPNKKTGPAAGWLIVQNGDARAAYLLVYGASHDSKHTDPEAAIALEDVQGDLHDLSFRVAFPGAAVADGRLSLLDTSASETVGTLTLAVPALARDGQEPLRFRRLPTLPGWLQGLLEESNAVKKSATAPTGQKRRFIGD